MKLNPIKIINKWLEYYGYYSLIYSLIYYDIIISNKKYIIMYFLVKQK